jgi:hypothetical protein
MGNPRAVGHLWATSLPPIIDTCATNLNAEMIIGLFAQGRGQQSYSYVFRQLANFAGVPAYMVHTTGRNTTHICQGLGHALLNLVLGVGIPPGFNYNVIQVSP